MVPPDIKVTSEILWQGAAIFALLDSALVYLLVRRRTAAEFRNLKWTLVITTAVFWCLIWLSMSGLFWDPVYSYVFPVWARWFIPPVYGVLFGCVGLLFWWLALRARGNATLNFILLGGVWGSVTHLWAISRGILEKPPMLQGVSPVSAIVLPFFEFVFYWCAIVGIASTIRHGRRWFKPPHLGEVTLG